MVYFAVVPLVGQFGLASHCGSSGSIPSGFIVSELEQHIFLFWEFLRVYPVSHHSAIAARSSVTVPLRCEVALIRQHIITTSVSKLGASSLIQNSTGYRVRELVVSVHHFVVSFRCADLCSPLTNSTEQRPSSATSIYCPSQEFPPSYVEPEVSLPCSLEAATGLYSNSNFILKL
jgi:hypothetical protein